MKLKDILKTDTDNTGWLKTFKKLGADREMLQYVNNNISKGGGSDNIDVVLDLFKVEELYITVDDGEKQKLSKDGNIFTYNIGSIAEGEEHNIVIEPYNKNGKLITGFSATGLFVDINNTSSYNFDENYNLISYSFKIIGKNHGDAVVAKCVFMFNDFYITIKNISYMEYAIASFNNDFPVFLTIRC